MSGRALRRWLLTLAAFFAVYFALRTSRAAMNALWYGVICPAEQWLGRLWGGWSLSVGEVLIVTAVCAALIAAANGIRYIVSARRKWRAAAQVLTTALCAVLTVYAGFCLLWGVGYNTDGFREKSGLTTAPVTADQLAQVTAYFADQLALSAGEVPRDGDGVCRLDYRQLLTGSENSLDVLTEEFPFLDAKTGRAKAFGCSRALSALRFTGFYFPFTGEANVNTDSPSAFLPATVCHEMAHQRGITAEEECNFIGILAAVVGAACYNKFKSTQMPDWLAFFSGKRFVAIATGLISIVVSVALLFVWPVIFDALVAIGRGIAGMDGIGAGIYAFLNRLLIPTGLHHALNNVFWFDTIGLGDLSHFWAGETSADVGWSLGMYMSGFFPCMMFGIAGAALAMVKTAKNKKAAIGLVLSAAICAFVCGVTEPFEFGFMFLCFPLYVVYSALYGIFTVITYYVGFRAGFCFSAGATDLVFSSFLPAANNTLMIIPLGIAAFVVFYLVFYFAITKFNLKTPGREDEEADFAEADKNATLANNDFTAIAAAVLEGLGGKENVESLDNCITRLRIEVKDGTQVNEKKIKAAGVAGVMRPSQTAIQVIIGTKVQFVADEMAKML